MRQLNVLRINIAARQHNINYNQLTSELQRSNVLLDRKILAQLAIHEPRTFASLAQLAKDRQRDGLLAALD